MTNLRLTIAMLFTLALMGLASTARAQTAPLVILTPDGVTGAVIFRLNTATNDARLIETCIYRVDANSPDPNAPIACLPVTAGSPPAPGDEVPSGEGVVLEIPATLSILPEDQHFAARNIADVAGNPFPSANSSNTAVLPLAVVAPLFILPGSGS